MLFPPAPRVRRGLSSDIDGRARIYGLRRPRSRRLSQYVYASLVCFVARSPKQTERRRSFARYPRVTSFPCRICFPSSLLYPVSLSPVFFSPSSRSRNELKPAFAREQRLDQEKQDIDSSFPSPLSLFSFLSVLLPFFSSFAPLCCGRCTSPSPSRYSTHHFHRQSQPPTCC